MKARSSMYIHPFLFLRIRCMLINRNHLLFIRLNKILSTSVNINQRSYELLYNITGKRKIRSPEFYLLLNNAAY